MSMTDLSFLLYFLPVMLVVYFALFFSVKAQNAWLVVCSLVFYTFGNYLYVPLLVLMVALNYLFAYILQARRAKKAPVKRAVVLAVAANLLPLFFFRYLQPLLSFFLDLFDAQPPDFPAAPIGIAFLALQGISYVVDAARGKVPWDKNPVNAALYLMFFPFMQAGPLLRYHTVADQIQQRRVELDKALEGGCRFVVGLGKAVLLGQPLLKLADIVFERSNNSGIFTSVPVAMALLGLAALFIGLYHYLSGYTDLVLGLGGVLGFAYPENFNYPILASSMTSFWQRSYTGLTAWFEEYVYQPLGKKRTNNDYMVLHLLLMWLLIGLWIGPGVSRLIFGLISFVVILVERIVELRPGESKNPFRHLYVLVAVLLALVALKTNSLYQFSIYVGNLFGMRDNAFLNEMTTTLFEQHWILLLVGLVASFPIAPALRRWAQSPRGATGKVVYALYPLVMLGLVALLFVTLAGDSYQPGQATHLYLWR